MKTKYLSLTAALALGVTLVTTFSARADILYASNNGNGAITRFTSGGVGSVFASSGSNGSIGLAFADAGNLYAANTDSNTIEKFTPGGFASVFASTGLNLPTGLAFDSAAISTWQTAATTRSRSSTRTASAQSLPAAD